MLDVEAEFRDRGAALFGAPAQGRVSRPEMSDPLIAFRRQLLPAERRASARPFRPYPLGYLEQFTHGWLPALAHAVDNLWCEQVRH